MKFWKDARAAYLAVQPPEELEEAVRAGIRTAKRTERERREPRPVIRYALCGAATLCMAFVIVVNASPVLAQSLYELPVVGNVARVFTFVQYEREEEADTLIVNLPALENTGNTALERRINYEIQYQMNGLVEEARQRAAEYKQAFVETGGEEDAFIPLEIYVDYRLHCNDGKIVSFVISKAETQASYYEELFFYNIDLQTGRDLTLRDLLGPDYREIVDQSVRRQIDERMAEDDRLYYFPPEDGGFRSIQEDQGFYVNERGNVVVVFLKYEIAPGYMGTQEFEILPAA